MEEKKETERNTSSNTEIEKPEEKNNIINYILKNKVVFSLIAIILILFIWATFRMNAMERQFEREKEKITISYKQQIDNVNITCRENLSRVFSWSVKDKHLQKNTKGINQLFLNYSQVIDTRMISLIDGESNTVLVSTDKTHEGVAFPNIPVHLPDQVTIQEESFIRIVSPLFDSYNKMIGILVIDYER